MGSTMVLMWVPQSILLVLPSCMYIFIIYTVENK